MTETPSAPRRVSPLMRRERTGIVALAVPNLEEPYFAELTTLLARGAEARGLSILIQQTEATISARSTSRTASGCPPPTDSSTSRAR